MKCTISAWIIKLNIPCLIRMTQPWTNHTSYSALSYQPRSVDFRTGHHVERTPYAFQYSIARGSFSSLGSSTMTHSVVVNSEDTPKANNECSSDHFQRINDPCLYHVKFELVWEWPPMHCDIGHHRMVPVTWVYVCLSICLPSSPVPR